MFYLMTKAQPDSISLCFFNKKDKNTNAQYISSFNKTKYSSALLCNFSHQRKRQSILAFSFAYKLFITMQFLSHRENIPSPLSIPTCQVFTIKLSLVTVTLIRNTGTVEKY